MTAPGSPAADDPRRLEREIRRLRHELDAAVHALPHLRQMVQFSGDLLLLVGPAGRILEANARCAALLGVPQTALYGQGLQRWIPNPGQALVLEQRLAGLAVGDPLRMELDLEPEAGGPVPLELEAHRLDAAGEPRWTLALRDIGERRQLQSSEAARQVQAALISSLRSSEGRYRELVAQLADGLGQLDASTRLLFANPALHRLLAVPEGTLEGSRLVEFVAPAGRPAFEQYWGALLAGQARQFELPLLAADGTPRLVAMELTPRSDGVGKRAGGPVGGVLLRDLTELRRAVADLTDLAFRDPLTGLANAEATRRELERRLAEAQERAQLVLWLDLDGFRRVNHSFGRAAGDALLRTVSDWLRHWAGPRDLLARLGGDEFLVVRELLDPSEAEAVVQDLHRHLAQLEAPAAGAAMMLGFSAGYSLAPTHGRQAEDLLQAAATALARAREIAPGTALRYEQTFTSELRQEMALEARLSQAIAAGGLRLVYQPQQDAQGRLVGCEALLRWNDPVHGPVSPAHFVAIAERTGLIHPLGQWVLEEACRQQRAWLDAGLEPPRLAVNLSPRQFECTLPPLIDQIGTLLARYRLPPDLLELEITESCILPMAGAIPQMEALAALGVRLALDDFGTGYSSLEVLNRLSIHKLKIDQSFVADLQTSQSARMIVRTALAMGEGLGLATLAEGVETQAQLAVLQELGCQTYQGYWFSRPLEVDAYRALLPTRGAGQQDGATAPRADAP